MPSRPSFRAFSGRASQSCSSITARAASELPSVVADEQNGARQVIDHLTAYGHRRIALLAGRFSSYITSVRYNAFLTAMQEHGISVDDSGIVMCGRDVESATQASVELLRRPERPTAVFAFNDVLAAGVIKAATRLGLRVPDDVAVVGFDDSSSCTLLTPELSSVHVDCRRMGEICLEQLTALLSGDTEVPRLTVVPVSLRTRASSIRL